MHLIALALFVTLPLVHAGLTPIQEPSHQERGRADPDDSATTKSPARAPSLFDAVTAKRTPTGPPPIIELLDVKDADIVDVLRFLCEKSGTQLVVDPSVRDIRVTCRLENISWLAAVNIITKNAGLACELEAGVLKTGK